MFPDRIDVLGLVGSLRERSLNRSMLEAARELSPESMAIDAFDLKEIPFYNQDLDADDLRPTAVERFKEEIREADALLIATPEYNHSIPGVLQNALDWASRPALHSVLAGKPVAIMGTSPGSIGTARAQLHLRQVLSSTMALVLPHPGVTIGQAREKFDGEGRLVDEATRHFLGSFLQELEVWVQRVALPVGVQ